jgi:hypothetical protein
VERCWCRPPKLPAQWGESKVFSRRTFTSDSAGDWWAELSGDSGDCASSERCRSRCGMTDVPTGLAAHLILLEHFSWA